MALMLLGFSFGVRPSGFERLFGYKNIVKPVSLYGVDQHVRYGALKGVAMATKSFCFFTSKPSPAHLNVLGVNTPTVAHVIVTSEELENLPALSLQVLSTTDSNERISSEEFAFLPSQFVHRMVRVSPRAITVNHYGGDNEWWPHAKFSETNTVRWGAVSYDVLPGTLELNPAKFLADLGKQTRDAVDAARTWYDEKEAAYKFCWRGGDASVRVDRIARMFGGRTPVQLANDSNAPNLVGPHGVLFAMPWEDFKSFREEVEALTKAEAERAAAERAAEKAARDNFITRVLCELDASAEMRERHERGMLPMVDFVRLVTKSAGFEPKLTYLFGIDRGHPASLSEEEYTRFTDMERKLRSMCGCFGVADVTPIVAAEDRCDEVYLRFSMRDASLASTWNRTVFLYLTSRSDD